VSERKRETEKPLVTRARKEEISLRLAKGLGGAHVIDKQSARGNKKQSPPLDLITR